MYSYFHLLRSSRVFIGSFAEQLNGKLQKICSFYDNDNNNNNAQNIDKCANMTIEILHFYFRSQSMVFQNPSQVAELWQQLTYVSLCHELSLTDTKQNNWKDWQPVSMHGSRIQRSSLPETLDVCGEKVVSYSFDQLHQKKYLIVKALTIILRH